MMGCADAYRIVHSHLETVHLADRTIPLPEDRPAPAATTHGTLDEPRAVSIGDLRAFLAARSDLSDEYPVVVGGALFDDHDQMLAGLADAVWSDAEGALGGRLCLVAGGIGLVEQ